MGFTSADLEAHADRLLARARSLDTLAGWLLERGHVDLADQAIDLATEQRHEARSAREEAACR